MATNTDLDSEIRSRIESFLAEISNLLKISALEAVREALGGAVAGPARRGPGRPRGSGARATAGTNGRKAGRRGSRGRRSGADLEAMNGTILDHVRANPGQGSEQIGAAIGMSSKEMRLPIQKLIAEGQLRTEGQRRGTKYFAGGRSGGNGAAGNGRRRGKGGRKGRRKGARKAA